MKWLIAKSSLTLVQMENLHSVITTAGLSSLAVLHLCVQWAPLSRTSLYTFVGIPISTTPCSLFLPLRASVELRRPQLTTDSTEQGTSLYGGRK
jgi:hypothetical protein